MYKIYATENTIHMWFDGRVEGDHSKNGDSSSDRRPSTKSARREDEIESTYESLYKKHSENFSGPQLRLWARMYVNGFHKNLDTPPNVPAITGQHQNAKRIREDKNQPLTEAITGAATAITKVLMKSTSPKQSPKKSGGLSPASKANLSGQYLQQLRTLQQLRENNALTEEEFQEQKTFLLSNIKTINA